MINECGVNRVSSACNLQRLISRVLWDSNEQQTLPKCFDVAACQGWI